MAARKQVVAQISAGLRDALDRYVAADDARTIVGVLSQSIASKIGYDLAGETQATRIMAAKNDPAVVEALKRMIEAGEL